MARAAGADRTIVIRAYFVRDSPTRICRVAQIRLLAFNVFD